MNKFFRLVAIFLLISISLAAQKEKFEVVDENHSPVKTIIVIKNSKEELKKTSPTSIDVHLLTTVVATPMTLFQLKAKYIP